MNLDFSFNIFFSYSKALLYLRNVDSFLVFRLPRFFFFKLQDSMISFLFLEKSSYCAFFSHFMSCYKKLFFFHFIRLRIKGLGYRMREFCSKLVRFFFGSTNFFYLHVPYNILVKIKKKICLLVSNDLSVLKSLLAQLLLLRRLSVYQIRGLVYPRQVIVLKVGKKRL
jgi:Ribosomal protein L6P/L9E